MTMTCGTCLYFTPAADGLGGCKRYPPVVNLHQSSVYPTTRADNWCGEYSADSIPPAPFAAEKPDTFRVTAVRDAPKWLYDSAKLTLDETVSLAATLARGDDVTPLMEQLQADGKAWKPQSPPEAAPSLVTKARSWIPWR